MQEDIEQAIKAVAFALKGKESQVRLAFCCLLAKGHLLIEDLPGMGKTTLAHALARVLGIDFNRVQFTSDMLPADILGASIFDVNKREFHFHRGPIFTQLLLADEINRTNPKTQSALLEAMAEKQVTVEGETYPLDAPFFVIATQNPLSQLGTFPLPESQLDRFLMRITLGYPSRDAERELLMAHKHQLTDGIEPCFSIKRLQQYQKFIATVHASDQLLDYLQALLAATRSHSNLRYGISPRGAIALVSAAKSWAFLYGRDYLIPEDVQAVAPSVFTHRLSHSADSVDNAERIVADILGSIRV